MTWLRLLILLQDNDGLMEVPASAINLLLILVTNEDSSLVFFKTSRSQPIPMGLHNSHPKLYPGDILEFPGNTYFSHYGIYYGERDGVPYVAHLTIRDSDTRLLLFGRAMNAAVKLDPLAVVGKKFRVKNYLDDKHPPRDFYSIIKPEIEHSMTKPVTFDILFNNSEHQATMFRNGVKKSEQIEKVYSKIVPTWKDLFEKKTV